MKIVIWNKEQTKKELQKRIYQAFKAQEKWHNLWEMAEKTVLNVYGGNVISGSRALYSNFMEGSAGDSSQRNEDIIGCNYAMKNTRFIHSQMSSNPPSVAVRNTTPDAQDRRKAEAGEALKSWMLRQYDVHETTDLITLETTIYGTGVGKVFFDKNIGDLVEFDKETGEIELEGDISYKPVHVKYFAADPDARRWKDVRYVTEKLYMPYEEACSIWPNKKELLEKVRIQNAAPMHNGDMNEDDMADFYDVVEIYEYWERGLPVNGFQGRYAVCLEDGTLLEPLRTNPHKFARPTAEGYISETEAETEGKDTIEIAELPYVLLTDIDIPNEVFGMSALMYAVPLQNAINDIDSALRANANTHSVNRLVLPDGSDILPGSITTDPVDIIKISGTTPPYFMNAHPIQTASINLREQLRQALDEVFGVNESMFGQQSRETSGFSMQYATNQGNMIRRRLFNKYTKFVETFYKTAFQIVRKHWTVPRVIHIIGDENEVQARAFSGADITGGIDLVGEYGTNFSLDPVTRRQEILSLYQPLQAAGYTGEDILDMLRLNEVSKPSLSELAKRRQQEIIQTMLTKEIYIAPQEWEQHPEMLAWLRYYTVTAEFYELTDEQKALVLEHKDARTQIAAEQAAAAQPQQGPGIGALQEAMQGAAEAPQQAPADVTQLPPLG